MSYPKSTIVENLNGPIHYPVVRFQVMENYWHLAFHPHACSQTVAQSRKVSVLDAWTAWFNPNKKGQLNNAFSFDQGKFHHSGNVFPLPASGSLTAGARVAARDWSFFVLQQYIWATDGAVAALKKNIFSHGVQSPSSCLVHPDYCLVVLHRPLWWLMMIDAETTINKPLVNWPEWDI